jgi:hypothetical protein
MATATCAVDVLLWLRLAYVTVSTAGRQVAWHSPDHLHATYLYTNLNVMLYVRVTTTQKWKYYAICGPKTTPKGPGELSRCSWTVRGSNPGGAEIFRTRSDWPWGPSSLLYIGYRVFPGGKAAEAWR